MGNDNAQQEEHRLKVLSDQGIMDTPPEESFDRITRLACRVFGVPVALVSLLDDKRQWFKSKQGIDVCETPRTLAVCDHAIRGTDSFIVLDLRKDPRFADNPLVTGEPYLAFYAGMPLRLSSGATLGTLCVIDKKPRASWTEEDDMTLKDLADIVLREIEIRALGRDALSLLQKEMQDNRVEHTDAGLS